MDYESYSSSHLNFARMFLLVRYSDQSVVEMDALDFENGLFEFERPIACDHDQTSKFNCTT